MQQFVLEEHLDILCSEDWLEFEELMDSTWRIYHVYTQNHQANSSRKWRIMIKNAKMEKSDLTLSTYVQYVEDF